MHGSGMHAFRIHVLRGAVPIICDYFNVISAHLQQFCTICIIRYTFNANKVSALPDRYIDVWRMFFSPISRSHHCKQMYLAFGISQREEKKT